MNYRSYMYPDYLTLFKDTLSIEVEALITQKVDVVISK